MGHPFPFRSGAVALLMCVAPYHAAADPTFDFYGQLNFGLYSVDDGVESETFFTDNDNSNSRAGIWIEGATGNGAVLKFNFEMSLGFEGSSSVTIDDNGLDNDFGRSDLRKFEVIYETPSYGTFYAGQGSTATDGITEADFSGTGVIAYVGLSDLAGSFQFRDDNDDLSGIAIGDVFTTSDGARRLRLRYDTPA